MVVNLADNDKLGIQLGISVDQKSIDDLGNDISKRMKPIKIKKTFFEDEKKASKVQADYNKEIGKTVKITKTWNDELQKYTRTQKIVTINTGQQEKARKKLEVEVSKSLAKMAQEEKAAESKRLQLIESARAKEKAAEAKWLDNRSRERIAAAQKEAKILATIEAKKARDIELAQAKASGIIGSSATTNFRTTGVLTSAQNAKLDTSGLSSAQTKYNTALSAVNLKDASSVKALINAEQQLINVRKQVSAQLSNVRAEQRNATATSNLTRQIENYLKVNSKVKASGGELYSETTGIISGLKDGKISTSDAQRQFADVRTRIKEAGLEAKTFGQSIKEAFGRYAAIGFATTGLLMIKQTLKKMVTAVKELDASIVNLQIATGMTYTQAKALLGTYTELGKQMGATTVQVAQAADSFLRQGYSVADSNELVKQSLMLSKLGQIDSAESTKYLTSAMKGYKVAVEDTAGIVDKLTAVDMEAAVTAGGIAEAMSMTANAARLAGVDMDKLIGIMTSTGEVSQAEMSRIGTAYKTMFARMANVKLGKMEDDEGVDITTEINDVEEALNKIGVPLRKSATEWNNFGDVLDQIGAKWSTLNGIQKSAIATGLGGVRQKEFMLTLFENYDKALSYEKTALESSGTAIKKYEDAYLGSIEAKSASFRASFEKLSMSIVNSTALKTLIDMGSATLSWLDGTDKFVPTLYRILGVVTAIGVVLKRNAIAANWQALAEFGNIVSSASAATGTAGTVAGASRMAQASAALTANGAITSSNIALTTSYLKLTESELAAALAQQKMTATEIEAELVKVQSITTTNAQTGATGLHRAAITGLTTKVKQATVAMLKFLATNPVGWAILATTAVVTIWKSFEYMGQEANRAREKLEEINTTFSESKDKLKSLGDEIDSNNVRIGELLSKGTLKLVEQDELDKLKQSNVALSLQLSTLKLETAELQRQAKIKADVLIASMNVDQSSGTMMGKTADTVTYVLNKAIELLGKIFGIKNLGDIFKFPEIPDSYDDLVNTNIDKVKQLSKEIESMGDPAFMGADAKAKYDSLTASLDLYKGQLSDVALKYQAIAVAYEGTDTGKDALKMVEKITYAISGAKEKSEIFYKEFSKTPGLKKDIESLSSSQALNAESVDKLMRKYPEFKIFIDELGISTEDLVLEFTNAIDPIAEMNRSIADLKTTMDGLPERMEDLEAINKKVSDGYHFSITEIDEIVKKYPQLESAVTRTAHGFQIASGAINTLSTGVSFTSDEIEFLEKEHGTLNATLDEATGLYYLNSDALSAIGTSAIQAKISYNQFQIDATKSALDGARARIEALKSETGALTTFMATLALVKQSGDTGSVLTSSEFWMMKRDGIKSVSGYSNYDEYVSGRISGISGSQAQAMREAQKQLEQYQSQLDRIGTGSVSGYTPEKPKAKTAAKTAEELLEEEKKLQKDAFEAQKAIIDRQLALNLITEEQYTNSLEALYKQFYSDKSKYLAEYTQYEIEVYNKRQSFLEQAQKDLESLHKATMDMIKKEKEEEKDALEKKKDGLKEYTDARKKALQDARDQDSYDKQIREKSTDIESIKAQLMGLSGDMSGAGMRKKTELTQRLKEAQDELSEVVADRQYEMQVEALDASYEAQEKNIDAQIEGIDAFLNNQNALVKASFDRMNGMSATLKSQLIAYNKEYGDGIANDIVKNWDAATEALKKYGGAANVETTLGVITTNIGRASTQVPTGYANGTSGLKRDSIIVGTHELLLNKTGSNAYQMMNAGSPIFTEQQTKALKALLSSPSSLLTKTVGGVGLNSAATVMSMANSNNSQDIDLHYEFNISGTDPVGIESTIVKLLPKIKDYTLSAINKDVQFNKGVRLTAANMT